MKFVELMMCISGKGL